MKILRTISILVIVSVLVIGGTVSVFAKGLPEGLPQGGQHSPGKHGLFGTVTDASVDVITVETNQGSTVNVTLTESAKYKAPRETQGWIIGVGDFVDDVLEGDLGNIIDRKVAVLVTDYAEYGTPPPDFTATAVRLMLIPSPDGPPSWAHRVGIVTSFPIDGVGEMIIRDNKGVFHTFEVTGETLYHPDETDYESIKVDESFVTVVTTGVPSNNILAKAIVLHDEPPEWEE